MAISLGILTQHFQTNPYVIIIFIAPVLHQEDPFNGARRCEEVDLQNGTFGFSFLWETTVPPAGDEKQH